MRLQLWLLCYTPKGRKVIFFWISIMTVPNEKYDSSCVRASTGENKTWQSKASWHGKKENLKEKKQRRKEPSLPWQIGSHGIRWGIVYWAIFWATTLYVVTWARVLIRIHVPTIMHKYQKGIYLLIVSRSRRRLTLIAKAPHGFSTFEKKVDTAVN